MFLYNSRAGVRAKDCNCQLYFFNIVRSMTDQYRIGRKLVFVLSMTGMILSGAWSMVVMWFWKVLPVRLVWLAPAFIFIGGGEAVVGMIFFAVGCDITTESNRYEILTPRLLDIKLTQIFQNQRISARKDCWYRGRINCTHSCILSHG